MRLLYVTNGFPPARWAGTERHTAALAEEFARRGAEVSVLCAGRWADGPAPYNGSDDSIWQNVRVRRLHFNWQLAPDPFGWLYDNPVAAAQMERMLNDTQPDVVHVTSCETLSASTLTVAKARRLPLVLSLMDFWFLCPRITLMHSRESVCNGTTTPSECIECLAGHARIHRWPTRVIGNDGATALLTAVSRYPALTRHRPLRGVVGDVAKRKKRLKASLLQPDVRITDSPTVRSVYQANGVDVPIEVYRYGHNLTWLARYEGKTPSRVLRVGYAGQVIPAKGVHVLLDAVSRLDPEVSRRLSVVVYGDTRAARAYGQRIEAAAEALPNVRLLGTYAHDASASVFANIDVLVIPSLWLDFPLAAHEALAAGTPVVATNLGGMAETIRHEHNGLLFNAGDASALAGLLSRLVTEQGLLERLRQGIGPVKSIGAECDELEGIYKRLLDQRAAH